MNIDQMIAALELLKEKHGGNIEVTVFQYGGGLDDLCDVVPIFDQNYGLIVLETTFHEPEIRR